MIHIIRNGSDRVLFLSNRLEFYRINEHTDEIINAMLQNIDHSIIERRYSTSSEEIASIKKVLKRDEQLAIIATEYPILRKLILNISNSCNLQCEYCYANGGNYHSKDSLMDSATANLGVNSRGGVLGGIIEIKGYLLIIIIMCISKILSFKGSKNYGKDN